MESDIMARMLQLMRKSRPPLRILLCCLGFASLTLPYLRWRNNAVLLSFGPKPIHLLKLKYPRHLIPFLKRSRSTLQTKPVYSARHSTYRILRNSQSSSDHRLPAMTQPGAATEIRPTRPFSDTVIELINTTWASKCSRTSQLRIDSIHAKGL